MTDSNKDSATRWTVTIRRVRPDDNSWPGDRWHAEVYDSRAWDVNRYGKRYKETFWFRRSAERWVRRLISRTERSEASEVEYVS